MKYIKAVLLAVIIVMASGTVWAQEDAFKLNETYPIADGGTLHLTSDDAEVTIEGTDRSEVHVVIYRHMDVDGWKVETSGKFDVDIAQKGGDLYITENSDEQQRVVVGSVREEYQITIQAPRNIALDIKGDDDEYSIRDIDQGITLEADDAKAKIINAGGSEFKFDMDDGRIDMDGGQGSLQLSMDDGTLLVREGTFNSWDAEMDDGVIEFGSELLDNGTYRLDMDDGEDKYCWRRRAIYRQSR